MTSLILAMATPLAAQPPDEADRALGHGRFEASVANLRWDALSQLEPAAGGHIRDSALGLGGAAHWVVRNGAHLDWLVGADLYVYTASTTVRHFVNDVSFRALQLTPSMKLALDNGRGPRVLLAFGLGYYEADITEISTYVWGQRSEFELWSDSTFGGYVGFDLDFPRRQRDVENGFFLSVRAHAADFGRVSDEAYGGRNFPTLGRDAGTLSGTMTTIHFGYQWFK